MNTLVDILALTLLILLGLSCYSPKGVNFQVNEKSYTFKIGAAK